MLHNVTLLWNVFRLCLCLVAHGWVVTSSRQIAEVKPHWAQFVLGWLTSPRVMLLNMCRGVGQASHVMPPLSTQQWWIPGGTRIGELWMALAVENALNSPQRRWDCIREFRYRGCKLSRVYQTINIHIYKHTLCIYICCNSINWALVDRLQIMLIYK